MGFVLWIPIMPLDMGTQANPYGHFLSSAALLLFHLAESGPGSDLSSPARFFAGGPEDLL